MKTKKIIIPTIIAIITFVIAFTFFMVRTNKVVNKNISPKSTVNTNTKSSNNIDAAADTNSTPKEDEVRFNKATLTRGNIAVPVLCYHDVNPKQSNDLLLDPQKFKAEMQYLKDANYIPITMSEFYGFLRENKQIPEKSVLITFDDGYKGNYTYAYPILKEFNFKATIFMISDFVDNDLYLSKDELKELSNNGIEIGSHTAKHDNLSELNKASQITTMKNSKKSLETILGKPVDCIAYPFGKSNSYTREAAKECAYKLGFNLNGKMADKSDNTYNIDRLYISNSYSLQQFINKLTKSPRN